MFAIFSLRKKTHVVVALFAILVVLILGIYVVWDSNKVDEGRKESSQEGSYISKDEAIKLINECQLETVRYFADEDNRVELQQRYPDGQHHEYYVPVEAFDALAEAFLLAADRCTLVEDNVSRERYIYITEQKAKELITSCQQVYLITDKNPNHYANNYVEGTKTGIVWNYKDFPLVAWDDENRDSAITILDEDARKSISSIAQTAAKTCPENTILF